MDIVKWIIAGALVLASVLMCVVVLVQQTKSSGIGAGFGSDTVSFSQRGKKASREAKLQKITVGLAIGIAVLAIALLLIKCFTGATL